MCIRDSVDVEHALARRRGLGQAGAIGAGLARMHHDVLPGRRQERDLGLADVEGERHAGDVLVVAAHGPELGPGSLQPFAHDRLGCGVARRGRHVPRGDRWGIDRIGQALSLIHI